MTSNNLSFDQILDITGDRYGAIDSPCPLCSHLRKPAKQRLKVLRVYRDAPDFARFHCVHCEAKGWVSDRAAASTEKRLPAAEIEKIKTDIAAREAEHEVIRRMKALGLWRRGKAVPNTPVERYLRLARGYRARIPATIRFLPESEGFAPAMIAAIGIADEIEPGILSIPDHAIRGVHITALLSDGSAKAGTGRDKIMIGKSIGSPIVLAPPNDGLGLAIAEGIEDAFSIHEATGLGAWAAGSASRMPALATVIPSYIDCVTVVADPDDAGRINGRKLADAHRGREVRLITPSNDRRAA
jgi:Toprim domain-containing protein